MIRAVVAALVLLAATPARGDDLAVTQHRWQAAGQSLAYRAEAGRLPLLDAAGKTTGEVFYVAYRVPSAKPRPVAFIWNGGPGAASTLLHLEAFGPRRIEGGKLADNPATLLTHADLVFVDPIGTGFSRAATPQAAKRFYSTTGDMAATADFIERWRERNAAGRAPIYLVGESYGVWRSAGTAELLERRGMKVAGIVLISGGVGLGEAMPRPVATALRIPNRTATALSWNKLDASVPQDRDVAVAAAERWARETYLPALERIDALTPAEREAIAEGLHRWTGFPLGEIDRKTLVVTPRGYLAGLVKPRTLNTFDMRITTERGEGVDRPTVSYLRDALGYRTELKYVGVETQSPDDDRRGVNARWDYNSGEITPEVMARAQAGEGPPGAEPWTDRAIAIDPKLKVLVAAGLYDSLNSCAANRELERRLPARLKANFRFRCYLGGHMMYRDDVARRQLSADVRAFVSGR